MLVNSKGVDFTRQTLWTKSFTREDGGSFAVKKRDDSRTDLRDLQKLPGSDLLDWRFNYYTSHMFGFADKSRFSIASTNLIQYWYYMKISVYDAISEYTLPDGVSYTEDQRTVVIFRKEKWDGFLSGDQVFGFYHKMTSNHQSVSPGGNKHTSIFYFEVDGSGELCPSDPIESLNSDLGLEWVYVKVSRDMWSDGFTYSFRTNLMPEDCVHTFPLSSLSFTDPTGITQLGPSKGIVRGKPKAFFYHILQIKEGSGGEIFIESDTRGNPESLIQN